MRSAILTPSASMVLAALTAAADAGTPCPTNRDLADKLNFASPGQSSSAVKRLEELGHITVARGACTRVIVITSTGKQTAGPAPAPHWRDQKASSTLLADTGNEAREAVRRREAARRTSSAARLKSWSPPEEPVLPTVYRDPCPRCGVRGDIGCRHSSTRLTGAAFG